MRIKNAFTYTLISFTTIQLRLMFKYDFFLLFFVLLAGHICLFSVGYFKVVNLAPPFTLVSTYVILRLRAFH